MYRLATVTVTLTLCVFASAVRAQRSPDGRPSILRTRGDSVHVQLLDAMTAQPIRNAAVEVWGDNGIRCVAPPCPTAGAQWNGSSDESGRITIPASALRTATSIKTAEQYGDLIEDSEPSADGVWRAELLPRDTSDQPPHAIKLIDARTERAIANRPLRIEFHLESGRRESVKATSNALGYVFVPFTVVALSPERTWVVVPGYKRTRLDFAWARRRTRLTPE